MKDYDQAMSDESIADLQTKWASSSTQSTANGQAYMNNFYRNAIDATDKPYAKPSWWQRFKMTVTDFVTRWG